MLQSLEVVKLVTGAGEPLIGRLLLFEALGTEFTELKVRRDPGLPDLRPERPRDRRYEDLGKFPDYELFCGAAGSRPTPARRPAARPRRRDLVVCPPMPKVKIPPVLRAQTGGESVVEVAGDDVGSVLRGLADVHPGVSGQLFDDAGELNRYVNVYLNDEDVRLLDGLGTAVSGLRHGRHPAGDGRRRPLTRLRESRRSDR